MKIMARQIHRGFTLIELMVVVAIIGVLAAIAIPIFSDYISRTRASGAIQELESLKSGMALCFQDFGVWSSCNTLGSNGVPTFATTSKFIVSLPTIAANGKISVTQTGATNNAGAPLSVILTPVATYGESNLNWVNSGSICDPIRGLKAGSGGC